MALTGFRRTVAAWSLEKWFEQGPAKLARLESDARVGAVAERLRGAAAAATQLRCHHTGNHAPGATRDLQVAANRQGAVELRVDGQHAVASRKRIGLAAGRLAGRVELNFVMGAVAERLVLRSTASAQGSAEADGLAVELELTSESVGTSFANARQVDGRGRFVVYPVRPPI